MRRTGKPCAKRGVKVIRTLSPEAPLSPETANASAVAGSAPFFDVFALRALQLSPLPRRRLVCYGGPQPPAAKKTAAPRNLDIIGRASTSDGVELKSAAQMKSF